MLFLLLSSAACGGPDPHFRGQPVTRVTVGDDVFDIRRRGRLAEAVRRNPRYAPRLEPAETRARQAMEAVTGCDVAEIRGDAAMVLGVLECEGAPERPIDHHLLAGPVECEILDSWRQLGGEELALVLDCDRI